MLAARRPLHLPRTAWNPGRQVIIAVVVLSVLALGFSGWLYVRGQSHEVTRAAPAGPVSAAATVSIPPLPAASPTVAVQVIVDVEGKVARPGVVRLASGSRVHEALAAAGGALPGADTTSLDLARVLVDGEQLRVDLPGTAVGPAASGGAAAAAGPVNLNSATLAALDALPGVGPVTAQRILDWRTQHGRFTSVGQLQEVPGIRPATYDRLAPLVTV